MRIPTIRGTIDRRILANYRIDPDRLAAVLPAPFRPQLVRGYGIGGICLIRLKHIRPKVIPLSCGLSSENAAHRIAVEWEEAGVTKQGVYIPRRDTNSKLNAFAGGRLFPGVHHHANFIVAEHNDHFSVEMKSDDGTAHVHVAGSVTTDIDNDSIFDDLKDVSRFFELGSLGYSDTKRNGVYDGIELVCEGWAMDALAIDTISSSYFEDTNLFPVGTVTFDCGLLMRNISHEWIGKTDLYCC